MSKMIQVRNVPDRVHKTLKTRAAAEGMSLSDYLKRTLEVEASLPTLAEIDARVQARGPSDVKRSTIVGLIRETRDA